MILTVLLALLRQTNADGFVDEVSCSSGSLTVMLNRSDPDIARWMNDPKSQPVVYVYGHKTLVPCGTSLKNDKGQQNYNLTIPYGKHCDVHLADLEPNYRTAETTIALEDNVDTSIAKVIRINHVFCLYTRSVQTIRYSDVSTAHEVLASTGGKPKPKVEMMFRSTDGRPLRTAKFGDTVEFYVALTPDSSEYSCWSGPLSPTHWCRGCVGCGLYQQFHHDADDNRTADVPLSLRQLPFLDELEKYMIRGLQGHKSTENAAAYEPQAYHGISPKECMFSDREDMLSPDARHLTFVQSSCPVHEMSEIIDPLANVNEEVYFSKFKTFRFGNQSTVFAQCTVQVCLVGSECVQSCFKRISNSNLTAERLRFRHRRAITPPFSKDDVYDQVSVRESLTILDDMETEEVSSRSTEQCLVSTSRIPVPLMLAMVMLLILCIVSSTVAVYLGYRLLRKRKQTSLDVYSVYSSSMSAMGTSSTAPIYGGYPRHHYVHHLDDNYR